MKQSSTSNIAHFSGLIWLLKLREFVTIFETEHLLCCHAICNFLQISATNYLSPGHARRSFTGTIMMVKQGHAKSSSMVGVMAMTTTSGGSQHVIFGADTIANVDVDC